MLKDRLYPKQTSKGWAIGDLADGSTPLDGLTQAEANATLSGLSGTGGARGKKR